MDFSRHILKQFGLTDNEINLYIAGMSMGLSGATELANKTGLKRPLVYHLISTLKDKGLVREAGKKHGRQFVMEPPTRLKEIVERKKRSLEQMEIQLEKAASELEALSSPKPGASRVRFYEGIEGMKNVAGEALKSKGKSVLVIASIDHLLNMFDLPFLQSWLKAADKKKIKRKSIWSKPVDTDLLPPSQLREQRIAPKDFIFPSTTFIYDDKVLVFSSPNEKSAFVIESAEYAQTMKALFEQVWRQSKP